MKQKINWLGTIATAVAILATFTTAVGGYYDVRARGEQTQSEVRLLREFTLTAVKTISDRQDKFETVVLSRWARVDDTLDQMLARGVRNETNIGSILEAIKELSQELKMARGGS